MGQRSLSFSPSHSLPLFVYGPVYYLSFLFLPSLSLNNARTLHTYIQNQVKKYIKIQIIHSIFPYKNCTNTINNKLLLKQSLPIYSDLVLLIRQTLPQSLRPCRWRGALTNVYFDWVLVADHSQGSSPPGLGPWVPALGDCHNVTNRRHPFPDPDQTSHSSWTTLPFNINSSGKQQIVCHQKIYINSSAKQIMLDVSSKYQFICKTNHVSSKY